MENSYEQPHFPQRVVVIGSRGVIGKEIVDHLNQCGASVLAVSSSDIDLLDAGAPAQLSKVLQAGDAIVMCSALTPDKGRDIGTLMKNLSMAQNVCLAIADVPLAQVVYLSSDAVYPFIDGPVDEGTAAAPGDLYGVMHRTREVMFADTVKQCPLAILRSTLVLAATDTHNSYGPNRFRRQARTDGKITLGGAGEETRDFIHVSDVARLVAEVVRHGSAGVLNLATGESYSFMDVARAVIACFDPAPEIATTERRAPITHRHFDVTAVRRAFPGFVFTPFEEAVREAHAGEFVEA